MEALWYLLILAPFIALPLLWWNHRRKAAQREEMAGLRWERMLAPAQAAAVDTAVAGPAAAPAAVVAGQPPQYRPRARLLDPAQTLVYRLLQSGLPDHEVLPAFGLAELVELPEGLAAAERGRRLRVLAEHRVDFIVCDKSMQLRVAVDLVLQEGSAAAPDFKARCLAEAGIRHVRLSRAALPDRRAIRALVLGG